MGFWNPLLDQGLILTPDGTGTPVTVGTTPATTAIPNLSTGVRPKFVVLSGLLQTMFFRTGQSTVAVTTTTGVYFPRFKNAVLNVAGMTHIAHVATTSSQPLIIQPLAEKPKPLPGPVRYGTNTQTALIGSGATLRLALPFLYDGATRPKVCMVTGHGNVFFRPGFSLGNMAAGGDGIRLKAESVVFVNTAGYTHMLARALTGSGRNIRVTALEI